MKKFYLFSLAVAMCSSVNAQSVRFLTFGDGTPGYDEPQILCCGMSPNGRYVCGVIESGDGYFLCDLEENIYLYDLATNPDSGAELRHVDNNGLAIGYMDSTGVTFSIDDVQTVLKVPDNEYKYILGEDLSSDGSIKVGSFVGAAYVTYGAYSRDGGEWTLLPTPPVTDYKGWTAKTVSGDGKVILGNIGTMGPLGPAVLWIMNDAGEYETLPLYDKYMIMNQDDLSDDAKIFRALCPCNVSNSGEYVLLRGVLRDIDRTVAVVYNVNTEEFTIYDEPQDIDASGKGMYPAAIDDNGTIIGNIGMPGMSTGAFILKKGETQAQTFGEAFPEFQQLFDTADFYGYHVATDMSADGQYILGYMYYDEDPSDQAAPAYFRTYVIDTQGENGVGEISSDSQNIVPEAIFSIDGKRMQSLQKGLNIIRMSDGSVRKIIK